MEVRAADDVDGGSREAKEVGEDRGGGGGRTEEEVVDATGVTSMLLLLLRGCALTEAEEKSPKRRGKSTNSRGKWGTRTGPRRTDASVPCWGSLLMNRGRFVAKYVWARSQQRRRASRC